MTTKPTTNQTIDNSQQAGQTVYGDIVFNTTTYQPTAEPAEPPMPVGIQPLKKLIGRQTALAHLRQAYHALQAERQGRVIYVTSQPGYGRQALLHTLFREIDEAGTPLVGGRFEVEDSYQPYSVDESYCTRLAELWPRSHEIAGVGWLTLLAQLSMLLGYKLHPDARLPDDPAATLKSALRRVARQQGPTVILLEAFDQAPNLWIELLRATLTDGLPLLFVLSLTTPQPLPNLPPDARTEVQQQASQLTQQGLAELVWLGRVSLAEVQAYLPPVEAGLAEKLHHLSHGVPAFIESRWQAWQESGAVQRSPQGVWLANPEIGLYPELRDEVEAMLRARLPDEATVELVNRVLQCASFEGLTFTVEPLADLFEVEADTLIDWFDDNLLGDSAAVALLQDEGFVRYHTADGPTIYEPPLHRYRFSQPYLWQMWQTTAHNIQPANLTAWQSGLADRLEGWYGFLKDRLAETLARLFEATAQPERAAPYRQRQQRRSQLAELHWQVDWLAANATTDLPDQDRLWKLRHDFLVESHKQGQYQGRLSYAEANLALARQSANQPREATSLNNLGLLLQDMGDYEAARPYLEQALTIRQTVLGQQHPDTATSLNNLGLLLHAMGDYEAAQPYLEEALTICQTVLGQRHPDTATSLGNLGSLLHAMGDDEAARPYIEQALTIRQALFGQQHPDTATSLNNLGLLLHAMGDHEAARPYYEQALTIRQTVLGQRHPHTATSLNNLGGLLHAMGDYEAAQPYLEEALTICQTVLGQRHPHTATSLNNLGRLLQDMGEYEAAQPYFEQALTILHDVLGAEHPHTQTAQQNLAILRADLTEAKQTQDSG